MTAILRSPPVQYTLAFLIWLWMALVTRTVRWKVEGEADASARWREPGGIIVAGWHSRILLLPAGWTRQMRRWTQDKAQGAMLISLSRDGEFVAKAIRWLGLKPIRGSSTNRRKRKDKGGREAIRVASEWLRGGGRLCITPDGPRGPRQRAGMGPILLARRTGSPILIYALAASPAKRLKTWDRFLVPFPFTRGAIVFDGYMEVPRDGDSEALRQELEDRLNAATRRAEALVGLSHIEPAQMSESREFGADAVKFAAE